MFDWCRGWSKVPEEFEPGAAATAVRIAEAIFPDGLKFTQLPYKLDWAQSQARLDAADKLKLQAEFAKLGGAAFLKAVSTAHARYGKALGITAQKPDAEPAPEVRTALDAFTAAVRSYVVQLVAYADANPGKGDALAQKLLQPLAEWQSLSGSSRAVEDAIAPGFRRAGSCCSICAGA